MTLKMQICSLNYAIPGTVFTNSSTVIKPVTFKSPSGLPPFSPLIQARAIEYMVVDALLAAEPVMRFADHITNPDRYLHLTDSIVELIQMSENPVSLMSFFSLLGLTTFRTSPEHRRSWIV